MHIGYARVSTEEQHTANQCEQLKKAGCELIYEESASGGRWDRPKLQDCLKHIRSGDVLIVWKLDRLTRSLADLLRILARIDEARAGFKSLTKSIDTTQAANRSASGLVLDLRYVHESLVIIVRRAGGPVVANRRLPNGPGPIEQ